MNITAEAVKQLRERTGAGMMECKRALVETKGDLDAAAELMRKQGLAKADKKATRVAAEGVVVVAKSHDGRAAAMVEVNCETDFVARERPGFAHAVAEAALAAKPASPQALNEIKLSSGESIEERRRALVAKIGENISVRRFAVLDSPEHLGAYVHGTRIGVLVALKGGPATLAHDLACTSRRGPRYLAGAGAGEWWQGRSILAEQA
jgi:elongation factor Ts